MKHIASISKPASQHMTEDAPAFASSILLTRERLGALQQLADLIITVLDAVKGAPPAE